jgi:hypothetical protein
VQVLCYTILYPQRIVGDIPDMIVIKANRYSNEYMILEPKQTADNSGFGFETRLNHLIVVLYLNAPIFCLQNDFIPLPSVLTFRPPGKVTHETSCRLVNLTECGEICRHSFRENEAAVVSGDGDGTSERSGYVKADTSIRAIYCKMEWRTNVGAGGMLDEQGKTT